MPKKRPIPKVDPLAYADEGHLVIKPSSDKTISVEMHHCTAFINEKEAMIMLLSLLNASKKLWGSPFVTKFLTHVDVL